MSQVACCGGFIDEGQPSGKEETIAEVNCYVATPQSGNGSQTNTNSFVVIATDVFGFRLPNARLIADSFAKELSIKCIVPDLFQGSEPPADLMDSVDCLSNGSEPFLSKLGAIGMLLWYFPGFLWRNPVRKGVERVERVVRHMRQQATAAGQVRVAVQGYCWGGRIAVLLAGSHPDLVDVICAAHPGGLTLPTDVDRVQIPAAFVLAGNDSTVKAPQIKLIEEAMEKKSFDHQVKVYPNALHGFAVRGDEKNVEVKKMREDAFHLAANFFKNVFDK